MTYMSEKSQDEELDSRLDEGLDETFPASDPVAVHLPDPGPSNSSRRRKDEPDPTKK